MSNSTNNIDLKILGGICCCIVILIIIVLPLASIRYVEFNEFAIVYDSLYRTVGKNIYTEGSHLISPTATLIYYPQTLQNIDINSENCISKDGIYIPLVINFSYQLLQEEIFDLFFEYGELSKYNVYIKTIGERVIYDVCSIFNSYEFPNKRSEIERTMRDTMNNFFQLSNAHSSLDLLQLKNYEYPAQLNTAIIRKQIALQDIQTAINQRAEAITDAQTDFLVAQLDTNKILIKARADADVHLNIANTQKTIIKQFWENRSQVFISIKESLNITGSEFVQNYLKTEVISIANDNSLIISI